MSRLSVARWKVYGTLRPVKSSRLRTLTVFLALACANAQLVLGSSLVASALTLGIYASHANGHSVGLQRDGNHLDVVLSHGGTHAHHHGDTAEYGDDRPSVSQGDHVVHITVGDLAGATGRRAVVHGSPALATSVALAPVAVIVPCAPYRSLEPRACGVAHLRTVVLRL